MKKFVTLTLLSFCVLVAALFWLAFLSPRTPLTTDPAVLAGDGSVLDYCRQPQLEGSGKLAADIPKGNTPGCAYAHFPLPVLARYTELLPAGATDICGLWRGVEGGRVGHVENASSSLVVAWKVDLEGALRPGIVARRNRR